MAVPTAASDSPIPQADHFLQQLIIIQKQLTENLTKASIPYKHHNNKKRRPASLLEVVSKVYLDVKSLKVLWVGRKLKSMKIVSLEVLERISSLIYQVEIPRGFSAHKVFHISRLASERRSPMEHQIKITQPPPSFDTHTPNRR